MAKCDWQSGWAWWCWYVSLGGNSSCSYLCFILTKSPGSVLENKGCRVLCGVHLALVQFTVNTMAGHHRGHIWVFVCGGFCHGTFTELGCSWWWKEEKVHFLENWEWLFVSAPKKNLFSNHVLNFDLIQSFFIIKDRTLFIPVQQLMENFTVKFNGINKI